MRPLTTSPCLDERANQLFNYRIDVRHVRLAERLNVLPYMVARYEELMGIEDAREMLKLRPSDILRAVRVNTLRTHRDALRQALEEKGFSLSTHWIPYALIVHEEPMPIGATHEYMQGLYYTQGLGPQTPVYITDPKPLQKAIDMAAAPGGKTTQIAQHQRDTTPVIALDVSPRRLAALKNNVNRLGVKSVIALNIDARIAPLILGISRYDYVLLDAPCTGEGLLPLDPKRRRSRTPADLRDRACLQHQLLRAAVLLARPGATIVYTTCSIAPEENEYVVDLVLRELPDCVEPVNPPLTPPYASRGVTSFNRVDFDERLHRCIRLYPHITRTEGFTICVLRRRECRVDTEQRTSKK